MNWRKQGIAALAALIAFGIFTLISGSAGMPALYAMAALTVVVTVLYLHYRRKQARVVTKPVTPARDPQRMPPKDIEFAVILRDKGICQLNFPGICVRDKLLTVDHIWPWSKGGSSTDMDNLQTACRPCNQHKSDKILAA